MDSNLNHHRTQIHSAELSHRAELHRLAARARASERGARPARSSRLHLAGLTTAIRTTGTRLRTVAIGTLALVSKTHRT
jgi:hypothetical protein